MTRNLQHVFAALWLAVIMALGLYCLQSVQKEGSIQFDIMALLPEANDHNMRFANDFMSEAKVAHRIVILFGDSEAEKARKGLEQFRGSLTMMTVPIQEKNTQEIEKSYRALYKHLFDYRAGLASRDDFTLLQQGKQQTLVDQVIANITSPFGTFTSGQIQTDPFGFFARYVTNAKTMNGASVDDQGNIIVTAGEKTWYVFQGYVEDKIFSLKVQEKINEELQPVLQNIQNSGVEILKVGGLFYAAAGAEQANREISNIGLISTLGIVLIMLLMFRGPRPILLAISVVTSGLIVGLAACLYGYGSIHILSLVFGSSLMGVAVDYGIHYFCASYKRVNNQSIDRFEIIRTLLPALPLGVLTSSIGYGLLMLAPFPGIQQMAVLACLGLLCTFVSVSLWGPYFIQTGDRQASSMAIKTQNALNRFASIGPIMKSKTFGVAAFVFIALGLSSLNFNDNVRGFQSLNPELKVQEERIKSMLSFDNSSRFVAVQAADIESLLTTTEAVAQRLDQAGIEYRAVTDLIPSVSQQKEARALKARFSQDNFQAIEQVLGIPIGFSKVSMGFENENFIPTENFLNTLPEGFRELISVHDKSLISRVLLNTTQSTGYLQTMIGQDENVRLIDPVGEYTSLFASYRELMMILAMALVVVFFLLLTLRNGLGTAFVITRPVVLSVLMTASLLGILGVGFSMFHAMGLILVLCIGIDYALFLFWRDLKTEEGEELLLLGNGLAAITTILSFGLLSLSATSAVSSFGLAVFIGIVLNFLITTLFLGKIECKDY